MRRIFIGFAAFVLASLGATASTRAGDKVPVQTQLSQTTTPSALPAVLGTQVDSRVQQSLAANSGTSAPILARAVGSAFDGVLQANAPAIAGDSTLVVAMAREAVRVVVAAPGLDAPRHVQIAAAIAASAAKAAPTAAASILVAVLQALPADEQTRQDNVIIANAIDAVVPDAQLTASLGTLPTAQPIGSLVSLLTSLANEAATRPASGVVSPH